MDDEQVVGHWPLKGDCNDVSGRGNHGVNHGVDLAHAHFDGLGAHVTVQPSESLAFGGDFSIAAWVRTERDMQGVIGDIVSKFDPRLRKGFTFCISSSAGGYNSHGDDQHLYFGIDDGAVGEWTPCGRPSPHSNYVSNSLTAFDGALYAATTDAAQEADWRHVFRYQGGTTWLDCGQVGNQRAHGVGPLVVHQGRLYAATWNYDWTRVMREDVDLCHVYVYNGGRDWIDCGQPGQNKRLFGIASYSGRLYVAGDDQTGGVLKLFVHAGGTDWQPCATFTSREHFFPHAMGVFAGKLYIGTESIFAYDGERLVYAGTPAGCTQVHSLEVFGGQLYAGTWPEGKVFRYAGDDMWEDCGRLGDSTEVNALAVYNGKLYAGSIPRAEVYRYEGGQEWTRLARFYSPPGWTPTQPNDPSPEGVNEWTRVTSLTIFQGRLFASIGSCTGSILDAPLDIRGEVFSLEAGRCVSYDHDLGAGARHVAATRSGGRLTLYVDGKPVAHSADEGGQFDIANDEPLRIGLGEVGPFSGHIWDVRLYDRPLNDRAVARLYHDSQTVS